MGSVVEIAKQDDDKSESPANWSIACSALTFAITLIVVLMHMHPISSILIVGTKIEGILCCILSIFWVATVSVVTDSRHGLAVDESGAVSNGNLYYFSWAGFVCSITLLISYLRHVFNVDVAGSIRTRSARLTIWSAQLATSLVVMGASSNFFDNTCGKGGMEPQCSRAVFGIVLGALATLTSVGVVGLKIATSKAPFLIESVLSFLLVVSYAFGVAFITSQEGPGAPLGNLYYFTWASFLCAFMLLASCFEDYNAAATMSDPTNPQASTMEPPGTPTMGENHVRMDSLEDNV